MGGGAIVACLPPPLCRAADGWDVSLLTRAWGGGAGGMPSRGAAGRGGPHKRRPGPRWEGGGLPPLGPPAPPPPWGGLQWSSDHGHAWTGLGCAPTIGRMPVCGRCGEDNPERARFCLACAGSLAASASPQAGGAQAGQRAVLRPGRVHHPVGAAGRRGRPGLLAPYYQRLRADLERYGGTVEKFIGDAVMALFGAPAAHEDDPERAVRAALAIREAIAELNEAGPSLDLHVRVGVTTGEALVALDARPVEGEGMASGDVVNTAARLQAAAPVDGILVDETTYRATDRQITYQPAEPVAAKGKAEPVAVWLALGAAGQPGRGRGPGARRSPGRSGSRSSRCCSARWPGSAPSGRAAGHPGRGARDGQEPAGLGTAGAGRGRAGADHLAAGPLPALRGGGGAVGAGGDGQGPGRHPGDRPGRGQAAAKLDRAVATCWRRAGGGLGVADTCARWSAWPERASWAGTAGPRRSRPGGGSWRRWPSRARPCW